MWRTWKLRRSHARSCREEGARRERPPGRGPAATLSRRKCFVREHHQFARLRENSTAGENTGVVSKRCSGGGADGRFADGQRRETAGALRISGAADRNRRDLPPG